jgi:hypothetical protein
MRLEPKINVLAWLFVLLEYPPATLEQFPEAVLPQPPATLE